MAFTIKRNDTRPILVRQLLDGSDVPIPLGTAAAVRLVMRISGAATGDPPLFKKTCVITNAAQGIVEYRWVAADTATPGSYEAEFEIDWGGGNTETVPNDSFVSVTVKGDLG